MTCCAPLSGGFVSSPSDACWLLEFLATEETMQTLSSMLRWQRLCRIALRQITVEIGQRYAREATPGNER